jgi:uncharacterized phage protein (TIGR01671 family)
MSRVIKFRVWDKERKQMIAVPGLSFGDDGSALTTSLWLLDLDSWSRCLVVGENCELMQDTGLLDSDGQSIFEGDILRPAWNETLPASWVDYQAPSFVLRHKTPSGNTSASWSEFIIAPPERQMYRVVGNIWQDAHLLEERP